MLRVRDLHVHFNSRQGVVHANNGVTFDVDRGELVGIVGESGSGKSVMLNTVLGLLQGPSVKIAGSVQLDEIELTDLPTRALRKIRGERIGFIAQNPFGALHPILPIKKQFRNLVRAHRQEAKRETWSNAHSMLERVGVAEPDRVLDGFAHELSGGMAQRVVIAMALTLDPELVIADEPTTALDLTVQKQILELIERLVREGHRSLMIATHDLGVVANFCDRVIVMYCGRAVEDGPVSAVFGRPRHPYTLALLQSVPQLGQMPQGLPGRLPDLRDPPDGCLFRFRCRWAMPKCAHATPIRRPSGAGRHVACHLDDLPEGPSDGAG